MNFFNIRMYYVGDFLLQTVLSGSHKHSMEYYPAIWGSLWISMILLGRWRQYQFCLLHGGTEGPQMTMDSSSCSALAYLGFLMMVIRERARVGVLMVVIYISSSRLWLWQIQKQCRKAVCLIQARVSLERRVIARSWDNRSHRIHG